MVEVNLRYELTIKGYSNEYFFIHKKWFLDIGNIWKICHQKKPSPTFIINIDVSIFTRELSNNYSL